MNAKEPLKTRLRLIAQIKKLRVKQHKTQLDMANLTGIDRANFARIERGEKNLQVETLARMAHAVGHKVTLTPIENLEEDIDNAE